jgi:hypothetical protein
MLGLEELTEFLDTRLPGLIDLETFGQQQSEELKVHS